MQKQIFHLISKKKLTHDVYELTFTTDNFLYPKPGQFVLFIIDATTKRAYSIAFTQKNISTFIIKKLEGWKGSTFMCELNIGDTIEGVGPLGHFIVQETAAPKLFIATGCWFAPLYAQVKFLIDQAYTSPITLVFGVRTKQDLFYHTELELFKQNNPQFSYIFYLSRDAQNSCASGYVTDFLTSKTISQHKEFYICGSMPMVTDVSRILKEHGVPEKNIFFEQF